MQYNLFVSITLDFEITLYILYNSIIAIVNTCMKHVLRIDFRN